MKYKHTWINVREYGYNTNVKDDLKTYIGQWKSWYQGNVKSFHNYFVYNGNRKIKQKRFYRTTIESNSPKCRFLYFDS